MIWRSGYTLILWAMLPLILARLWFRARKEPGYRLDWRERFGCYAGIQGGSRSQRTIWVHAVSLGEVRAARPLVEKLLARYPRDRILFTQMTATGREAASEMFGDRVQISWLPYDYPYAVQRFLDRFQPDIGIFIETEIWFNLIEACMAAGVPLFLANARLSQKSSDGYSRIAPLARRAFGAFDAVAAQTEADAGRFSRLGARTPSVIGNIKFDAADSPGAEQLALEFRARYGERAVFLAANTREGEEEMLMDALAGSSLGEALVVIVPRHPDRFDHVAGILNKRGLPFVRRSSTAVVPRECRFFLGDSLGEMGAYYRGCDVAFVGGSLLDYGGHNLIEACAAGVPVLIGPYTRNFDEAAALAIQAGAALRARNAGDVVAQTAALLANPPTRAAMAIAGREFCARHRGATDKLVDIAAGLLEPRGKVTAVPA